MLPLSRLSTISFVCHPSLAHESTRRDSGRAQTQSAPPCLRTHVYGNDDLQLQDKLQESGVWLSELDLRYRESRLFVLQLRLWDEIPGTWISLFRSVNPAILCRPRCGSLSTIIRTVLSEDWTLSLLFQNRTDRLYDGDKTSGYAHVPEVSEGGGILYAIVYCVVCSKRGNRNMDWTSR